MRYLNHLLCGDIFDGLMFEYLEENNLVEAAIADKELSVKLWGEIKELFENTDNYLGEKYPAESDYDIYSTQGSVVYIQIWLDNPEQYTILSLKLNCVIILEEKIR